MSEARMCQIINDLQQDSLVEATKLAQELLSHHSSDNGYVDFYEYNGITILNNARDGELPEWANSLDSLILSDDVQLMAMWATHDYFDLHYAPHDLHYFWNEGDHLRRGMLSTHGVGYHVVDCS